MSAKIRIPFNKPVLLEGATAGIGAALESGHVSGLGPASERCEARLSELLGVPALLCTSATHALEMCALLLDIAPGDEVILPSFTFVSTANAFALRGARLRFADNDENGNLTLAELDRLWSPRCKAVVVVHYGGNSADMTALTSWCAARGVPLVEDAAQAIGARYGDRPLGTFGALACLSFHETKNVTSGEGGALIPGAHRERAEIIREKGTNRRQFMQGLADKYTWVDLGSSYVLSDLNAAYLAPQLDAFLAIQARRQTLWQRYLQELAAALTRGGVRVLTPPAYNTPNHHMFALVLPSAEARVRFIAAMKERGILTPFHYVALHTSPFGRRFGPPEQLPQCEALSSRLVRLPLYYNLSDDLQAEVIAAVKTLV